METMVLPDLAEIIELSGINRLKVRNVYVYGSRVYGYNRPDSDFDIMFIAPNLLDHTEIKNPKYNIHIVNPDKFKNDVMKYEMHALECIFAPDWAKLQIKETFADFKIDNSKFKQSILTQSSQDWHHAKYKFQIGDGEKALKSAYHSFKTLMFGIQILEQGKIYDFSQCNDLHAQITNEDFYEWKPLKEKYLSQKIEIENNFKKI